MGEEITGTATIFPAKKYPFKILDATITQGNDISFRWKAFENNKGAGYLLTATNLKKEKGRYYNRIVLKTDSSVLPEIPVLIYGNIFEPSPD